MPDQSDGPAEQPAGQPGAQIVIEPAQMAGVWANVATMTQTIHEFTLDFIRMDGTAQPPGRGIVVARVAFSPLMAGQLADLLKDAWQRYAQIPDAPEDQGDEDPEDTPEG